MTTIVGYLYTFDGQSVLLMPDEVEPDTFAEYPELYQAVVLAGKCERCAEMNCGMSWSGNNVYGNSQSIKSVKDAVHYAGQVPELKERISQQQEEISHWKTVGIPQTTLPNDLRKDIDND